MRSRRRFVTDLWVWPNRIMASVRLVSRSLIMLLLAKSSAHMARAIVAFDICLWTLVILTSVLSVGIVKWPLYFLVCLGSSQYLTIGRSFGVVIFCLFVRKVARLGERMKTATLFSSLHRNFRSPFQVRSCCCLQVHHSLPLEVDLGNIPSTDYTSQV